jgi:hypothetical protein
VNKDLALDCLQQIGINLRDFSLEKDNDLYYMLDLESKRDVCELGE